MKSNRSDASRQIQQAIGIQLIVDGVPCSVQFTADAVKDLGVTLDAQMSFKPTVSY